MMNVYNCPNCGAILTRNTCDFCGTQIFDFTSISDEHPAYIKVSIGGNTILFKALLESASIRFEDNQCLYCDNEVYVSTATGCVSLELNMLYDDDGNLFKTIERKETQNG